MRFPPQKIPSKSNGEVELQELRSVIQKQQSLNSGLFSEMKDLLEKDREIVVNMPESSAPDPKQCSWTFDIHRDKDGKIKSITATPT